jgi:hypothetical protein
MGDIEGGTEHGERAIKYATKYITKDLVDATFVQGQRQRAHFDRLHAELAVLPWSPGCAVRRPTRGSQERI